jgi:hypothetical protein
LPKLQRSHLRQIGATGNLRMADRGHAEVAACYRVVRSVGYSRSDLLASSSSEFGWLCACTTK